MEARKPSEWDETREKIDRLTDHAADQARMDGKADSWSDWDSVPRVRRGLDQWAYRRPWWLDEDGDDLDEESFLEWTSHDH